jgi:hypothetical protein
MLEVDTSGIRAYVQWMRSEMRRVETEVRTVYRQWALTIHADIADLSPQWSGNLAANWVIEANGTSAAALYIAGAPGNQPYRDGGRGGQGPVYSRGMDPAVSVAIARAKNLPLPALSDVLYIHNPVTYAGDIEMDSTVPPVRAINRLPRDESGKIAMVHHAAVKYDRPLPKGWR